MWGIGSIAAVILGYLALRQIRRDPLRIDGKGMAVADVILGWLGVAGLACMIALGIYIWKNDKEDLEEPRTEQVHSIRAGLVTSPHALPSAALADVAIPRAPFSGALGCREVISHEDGSASSRLTSCVCNA